MDPNKEKDNSEKKTLEIEPLPSFRGVDPFPPLLRGGATFRKYCRRLFMFIGGQVT